MYLVLLLHICPLLHRVQSGVQQLKSKAHNIHKNTLPYSMQLALLSASYS
jgi:hypothetical protein